HLAGPGIGTVDDDADGVVGDRHFDEGHAGLAAGRLFLGVDVPGRVGDVELAGAEPRQAGARARLAERELLYAVLLVVLLHGLGRDRVQRARSVDDDGRRRLRAGRTGGGGDGKDDCSAPPAPTHAHL